MSDLPHPEPLSPMERRVLGVLIEKQKTSKTPDAYPMTINSLTTGCNQRSNRDPVVEFDEDDVEECLITLSKRALVNKIVGGRSERWRHLLYDAWKVTQVEMAILAELLLRGTQSEGDLRGRASRMNDIADLDALRELLQGLVSRKFVEYLTPIGRGAIVTHGFWSADELTREKSNHSCGPVSVAMEAPRAAVRSDLESKLAELVREVEELKKRVAILEG